MKTIVVSAVNIRKGGTLTILRNCLEYLSYMAQNGQYKVVAIVHKRELANYPLIEYIEKPDTINGWGKRLWCEYVVMHRISRQLAPVYLWLSLHDTTPFVKAERQAVYCQTSFPFSGGNGKMQGLIIRLSYLPGLQNLPTWSISAGTNTSSCKPNGCGKGSPKCSDCLRTGL